MNTAFLKSSLVLAGMLTAGAMYADGPTLLSADPADGSTVASLETIETVWDTDQEWNYSWSPISVFDLFGEQVTTAWLNPVDGQIGHFTIYLDQKIVKEGRYVVMIPEDVFEMSMELAGEPANLSYYVDGSEDNGGGGDVSDARWTFEYADPADGSTVPASALQLINTYWNVGNDMPGVAWDKTVTLKDAAGNWVANGTMNFDWDDPSLFPINFYVELQPGEYTVEIPAGILIDDNENPGNAAVTLHYTVEGAVVSNAMCKLTNTDPTDGGLVTAAQLKFITTTWSRGEEATLDFDAVVTLKDAAGNVVENATCDMDWNDLNNFTIAFTKDVEPGKYTVEIPAGWLVEPETNKPANDAVTLTYTVVTDLSDVKTFEATSVLPKPGSELSYEKGTDLNMLNFTYAKRGMTLVNEGATLTMACNDGETYESNPVTLFADGANTVVIVSFDENPIKYSGEYTLTIPQGVFKAGEEFNAQQTFTWTYIERPGIRDELPPVDETEFTFNTLNVTNAEGEVLVDFLDENVAIPVFPQGTLNIGINREKIGAVVYYIRDITTETPDILHTVWTYIDKEGIYTNGALGEDGCFHFRLPEFDIKLYEDHKYDIYVEAYWQFDGLPAEERIKRGFGDSPVFTGTTPEYKYSDVDIVKITPAPGSEFDVDNRSFSITYSGPVTIFTGTVEGSVGSQKLTGINHGMEGMVAFESIESNTEQTTWTFTIPVSDIKNETGLMQMNIAADDLRGRRVLASEDAEFDLNIHNAGEGLGAHQQIAFRCYAGCPPVTVEPGSGTVESLYAFRFTCPEAQLGSIQHQNVDGEGNLLVAVLRSSSGAAIATLDGEDIVPEWNKNPDDGNATDVASIALNMHLDKEITTPGIYTLDIPACYFMTGTEYSSQPNGRMRITYIIEGEIKLGDASVKDGEVMSAVGLVAVYAGDVTLADGAEMVIRRGERDREPKTAPLFLSKDELFTRVMADFTDPNKQFAPYELDPRDAYNEGMGQDYEIVVPEGSVLTTTGQPYSELIITIHCPGANETAKAETVALTSKIGENGAAVSNVVKGEAAVLTLEPAEGWKVEQVLFNGEDVTEEVAGNAYTTPALVADSEVEVTYAYAEEIQVIEGIVGVTEIFGTNYTVEVQGEILYIKGLAGGEVIKVYSLGGVELASLTGTVDTASVVLSKGTFIVTINGTAIKVIL